MNLHRYSVRTGHSTGVAHTAHETRPLADMGSVYKSHWHFTELCENRFNELGCEVRYTILEGKVARAVSVQCRCKGSVISKE